MKETAVSKEETVHEMARLFMERHQTVTLDDTMEPWFYDTDLGYYIPLKNRIAAFCESILGAGATMHLIREVSDKVGRYNIKNRLELEKIASDMMLINLKNGLYDLKTGQLFPHNPNFWSINRLPITFNADKKCPNIKKFLSSSLSNEGISLVKKLLGDILLSDYRSKSLTILYGSGNNGKGLFGELLAHFVGPQNFISCTMKELADEKFYRAELFGKMVNFHGDISSDTIENWDTIRTLTGNDRITVRRLYGNPFQFINRAKLIFACNELPKIETAYSTMSRIILIEFPNSFENSRMDRSKLLEKMSTEDELSGLLNFAISGLKQLLREGPGDPNMTVSQTMKHYDQLRDHVKQFIDRFYIGDPDGYIEAENLREQYEKYCNDNNIKVKLDKIRLGSRLNALGINLVKKRIDRSVRWVYVGLNRNEISQKLLIERKTD